MDTQQNPLLTFNVAVSAESLASLEAMIERAVRRALVGADSSSRPRETKPSLPSQSESYLVDTRTAAKLLGVSGRHLYAMLKTEDLRPVRLGHAVRYDRRDLLAWLDRKRQKATHK